MQQHFFWCEKISGELKLLNNIQVFFSVAHQKSASLGRLIVQVSISNKITYTHTQTHLVGFLWKRDQPIPKAAAHT